MKKQQPPLPRNYQLTNEIARSAAQSPIAARWSPPKSRALDPNKSRRKSMKNITLAKNPPANRG